MLQERASDAIRQVITLTKGFALCVARRGENLGNGKASRLARTSTRFSAWPAWPQGNLRIDPLTVIAMVKL